jgi:hypothetical protein
MQDAGQKSETAIQNLNKHYSTEFLHRVQKGLLSSFESEFGGNEEEIACAGLIKLIIWKFGSSSLEWLTAGEKIILAEDTISSPIKNLFSFSNCLIPYD